MLEPGGDVARFARRDEAQRHLPELGLPGFSDGCGGERQIVVEGTAEPQTIPAIASS